MGLTKKRDISQTWGSHQPLLKAVVEVLRPRTTVECGCGNYSTPILVGAGHLHTIEHDPRWAKEVSRRYPHHRWTIFPLQAKNSTQIHELPTGEYQRIRDFYARLAREKRPFDLLFVDTFTACRVPAVLSLGEKATWIVIHDLEPPGPDVYRWYMLNEFFKRWAKYLHRPEGKVAGAHQIPWTGLYCRGPLIHSWPKLNEVLEYESNKLWGRPYSLESVEGTCS